MWRPGKLEDGDDVVISPVYVNEDIQRNSKGFQRIKNI
jgi:hypothetical protein